MQQRRRSIPNITLEDVTSSDILEKYIYPNLDINYYWSDDFSPELYIALARAGFICVSHEHEGRLLLLPEMQEAYAVLDFKDLHISKKVASLNNRLGHRLEFNTRFDDVLASIQTAYENCWMVDEYAHLMQTLLKHTHEDFSLFSTELIDSSTGELIAGEIGYITRNIYTSLSGFHRPDKRYNNWGTLQLVLLAQHLEEQGVRFWNLGHPYMEYKTDLGAKILIRDEFLKRWAGDDATNKTPIISPHLQQLYDDIESKTIHYRVSSEYETGIAQRFLLEEDSDWETIEPEILHLSEEICGRFKHWCDVSREMNPSYDRVALDKEGLELAKALKQANTHTTIVDYQYPQFIQTIISYQIRADYMVSLWNDTWSAIDVEWIEEGLGGYVIEERDALEERFKRWEDWYYLQLTQDIDSSAFDQEGEALTDELRKRLPDYCVVYFISK